MELRLQFKIENPSRSLLVGLRTSGKHSLAAANQFYSYYREVLEKFDALLRTVGNLRHLMDDSPMGLAEFYGNGAGRSSRVEWWLDSGQPVQFQPKLPRSRRKFNSLFQRDQLIDTAKWAKMQRAIDTNMFPSDELVELLRLQSRVTWRGKKVPTIEAAVFAESVLRDYGLRVLGEAGLSKTRLQSIRDDLSFSLLLNAILPLTLSKKQSAALRSHITAVDVLRKIRNDLVHGNIAEKDIDEKAVRQGIDSTVRLVQAIRTKR